MDKYISAYQKTLKPEQKPNYQIPLQQICAHYQALNVRPKVLIHACCAVCSSPGLDLLARAMKVYVVFYNPNIHPHKEYQVRLQAQQQMIIDYNHKYHTDLQFVATPYQPRTFFHQTQHLADEAEGTGKRCPVCYELRMAMTAQLALEMQMDYFCTSLTLSPMKNSVLVNEIGFALAKQYGVNYLASDFKKSGGTERMRHLTKEFNIYRQKYCGCVYGAKQQGIKLKDSCKPAQ